MMELTLAQKIAIWTLPILLAIVLHEVAHGWVAWKLGDPTAKSQGRLTLNPLSHIDPIGTLLVPLVLLVIGGFIFGWAKPVPVDHRYFKHPHRDLAKVAIAGPMANFLMAIGWGFLAVWGARWQVEMPTIGQFLFYSGLAGVQINLILAALNLLPIPPLDGSRIVAAFLPSQLRNRYYLIEPYGFFILLGLIVTGLLNPLITPIYAALKGVVQSIIGVA
ncbi:MAG TPA: site-2 protease family protein [Piscirickettsiaceae bacterium]|nr:site-2 protease family protein [Piscirickettsiaceae bacterium]